MTNLLLFLMIIVLFFYNLNIIESFDRFMEPSDNYNLQNKTYYYNRLRNTIGCSNLI